MRAIPGVIIGVAVLVLFCLDVEKKPEVKHVATRFTGEVVLVTRESVDVKKREVNLVSKRFKWINGDLVSVQGVDDEE